jgi:hypothetical protein
MAMTTMELVEHICKRPWMFFAGIETTRELIAFLSGVCCSEEHLHGHDLGGFSEYLRRRFGRPPFHSWPGILWQEFGNKPYEEGRDGILTVLREWFAFDSQRAGKSNFG